MKTIHFSELKKFRLGVSVGIGKFDGVHLGHKKIIGEILKKSENGGLVPAIFTFRNFPVDFLISSWEEKLALIENAGIKVCVWADFQEVSKLNPDEFISRLSIMVVNNIVVGRNFHFGAGRKGDVSALEITGKREGFNVTAVDPLKKSGEIINSTAIRRFIKHGEMDKAASFLGRNFSVEGKVVHGEKIGSGLGFPTANLDLGRNIPLLQGVYSGKAFYEGKTYSCAIHFGSSPTFPNKKSSFEVLLLNFNKEIYGKNLKVEITKRIRAVYKFKDTKSLSGQIKKDVAVIKKMNQGVLNK